MSEKFGQASGQQGEGKQMPRLAPGLGLYGVSEDAVLSGEHGPVRAVAAILVLAPVLHRAARNRRQRRDARPRRGLPEKATLRQHRTVHWSSAPRQYGPKRQALAKQGI